MTATLTRDDVTAPTAMSHDPFQVDRSAGFGQYVTRVHVNGEHSYRFEITDDGELVATFRSWGEIAMAIYLSDRPVTRDLPTERIAELVVAGIDRNGYARVADQAARWQQCANLKRHEMCTGLAFRLSGITEHPRAYPDHPQWQPDWRQVTR